jgi:hypothetical protein
MVAARFRDVIRARVVNLATKGNPKSPPDLVYWAMTSNLEFVSTLKFKGKCVSSNRVCLRNHLMLPCFQRRYDGMLCGENQDSEPFSFFECADLFALKMLPQYKMLGKVAIRLARTQQLGSKRAKINCSTASAHIQ